LVASQDKAEAVKRAKSTAFYKHTKFDGAKSHIDDKYGVDVDDLYQIEEILSPSILEKYAVLLSNAKEVEADLLHLGYFKLASFKG